MRRLRLLSLILAVACPGAALAADAVGTVRAFYGPPIWNPLETEDYAAMTGPARALFEKSAALSAASGEMGCIDFVVTASGQDYDEAEIAKTLKLKDAGKDANGDTRVAARFHSFAGVPDNPETEIVWTMHKDGAAWKVSDMENARDGWKLSEMSCE